MPVADWSGVNERMPLNPVVVIPVYNHPSTVGAMAQGVLQHAGLPCILVNDGSTPECAAVMNAIALRYCGQVQVLHLPHNQGKGGAMMAGLRLALKQGFTHAVQIDADGQHCTADIPKFLRLASACPQAMVCGVPLYDASVPKARLYGRYATHIWVWINTLSLEIKDSMCGFRVYPLASTVALFDRVKLGQRMDFDTEVLVRLHWQGVRVVSLPTQVTYPQDGISHFDVWRDNLKISRMHALLFVGMLWRSPQLLIRNLRRGLVS